MIKYSILSVIQMVLMTGLAMADQPRVEVSEYARVYKSDEGVTVTILRYGPREKSQALVQIRGIDHPWDNQIFLHTIKNVDDSGKADFTMIADNNEPFTTVTVRSSWWSSKNVELWLPEHSKGIRLTYSNELSNDVKPQHFLTAYEQQEANKPKKKK